MQFKCAFPANFINKHLITKTYPTYLTVEMKMLQ